MNNESPKFRHTQKQDSLSEHEQKEQQTSSAKEFASVEELLRHDAKQVAVPPTVAAKLNESIANSPKPEARSWWQRLFPR